MRRAPRQKRLTDLDGVVEYLHDTERHVRGLVERRRIPYYKVGSQLRFDLNDIDRWLDNNKVEAIS